MSNRLLRPLSGCALVLVATAVFGSATALAQESSNSPGRLAVPPELLGGPTQWTSPEGLSSALQVMLLLTVVSLAPAVLLMTTCFVRVLVVPSQRPASSPGSGARVALISGC